MCVDSGEASFFNHRVALNLRLECTPKKPMRDMNIWPALPLIVHDFDQVSASSVPKMITALNYHDRVCQIDLEAFPLKHVARSKV